MSQPSLYHYFRSKDELVRQVLHSYTDEVAAGHVASLNQTAPMARPLMTALVDCGMVAEADVEGVLRIGISPLVTYFMAERVLGMQTPSAPRPEALADFVVDIVVRGAQARARDRRLEAGS